MEIQSVPVMGKGECHTECRAHHGKKMEMDLLVRIKTSQERKKKMDIGNQGKWKSGKSGDRIVENSRGRWSGNHHSREGGKMTCGFWPDGQDKGRMESPEPRRWDSEGALAGTHHLCQGLEPQRTSSYRYFKHPHLIRLV